jgi:glucan 1,3-beta-glucosidase
MWAIVGEWTPAPTDCAKYLNGRGRGARYDGTLDGSTRVGDCSTKTGSGSLFDNNYKTFLRQYWEAQVYFALEIWILSCQLMFKHVGHHV